MTNLLKKGDKVKIKPSHSNYARALHGRVLIVERNQSDQVHTLDNEQVAVVAPDSKGTFYLMAYALERVQ